MQLESQIIFSVIRLSEEGLDLNIWLIQKLSARLRPFLSSYVFVSVPVFYELNLLFRNLVHLEYLNCLDSIRKHLLTVTNPWCILNMLLIRLEKLF